MFIFSDSHQIACIQEVYQMISVKPIYGCASLTLHPTNKAGDPLIKTMLHNAKSCRKLRSVVLSGSTNTYDRTCPYWTASLCQCYCSANYQYQLHSLSRSQLLTVFSSSTLPGSVTFNRNHSSECCTVWCCTQNLSIWKYPQLAITGIHIKICICKKNVWIHPSNTGKVVNNSTMLHLKHQSNSPLHRKNCVT